MKKIERRSLALFKRMMQKLFHNIKHYLQQNKIPLLFAFFIPLLVMVGLYASLGIYPGSSRSILASDAFSQFSNFHASFNNVLKGDQSPFYTFNAGLGLNYYALISYYLGGLFTPLVVFFNNSHMPDALYFLTLLKIACAGLACFVFVREVFPKLRTTLQLGLSTTYNLMSFTLAQSELIMWLDAFVYLPLVILGIHRLFAGKKPTVLFVSYLLLFISNYYFGFMIGLFSFFYFLICYANHWKEHKKIIIPYLITALLAGFAAMIMILPMFLDLRNNGETLTQIAKWKTDATGIWDLIAKNMVGVYDTTKYNSIPFIYIGLLPLIFAVFAFFKKTLTVVQKVGFFLLGALLVASFYIEPLNLVWHGFHSPYMFLFRYSFLFSFLILVLAAYGLEAWTKENSFQVAGISIAWIFIFSLFWFIHKNGTYVYIQPIQYYLTMIFLCFYTLFFICYQRKILPFHWIGFLTLFTMTVEATTNGYFMLNGILDDWNYASRSLYTEPRKDILPLVEKSKELSHGVKYRLEDLDPISVNDSFNFNYSGVGMFSSIRNRNSSALMNQLGFRARGTALNARYENNTLLMDSLLGVRYNISKSPVTKFGFKEVDKKGDYRLFENQYALPLGVKTSNAYQDIKWVDNDNLGDQKNLVNALSDQNNIYYTSSRPKLVEEENSIVRTEKGIATFKAIDSSKPQNLIYEVFIPAWSQAYFSIFPENFGAVSGTSATVSKVGGGHKSDIKMTGQYYNLGYFDKNTKLRFRLTLEGKGEVKLVSPPVINLNLKAYEKAFKTLKENEVPFKVKGRKAEATITMEKGQTNVFTTIPFDKGWSVYVDDKKVEAQSFRDGFLTFSVPEGKHKIELSFFPQGLKVGIVLFVLCTTAFFFYQRKYRKERYLS